MHVINSIEMTAIKEARYYTIINILDYHSKNARMTAAAANKLTLIHI